MDARSVARVTPQVIFGLGIIAIGVILLLHNIGILYARSYLSYWPVILILIGLASALQPSGSAGRWVGLLLVILGVLLLLDNLYIIDFYVWDYWPLLLILAGFALLRASRRPHTSPPAGASPQAGLEGSIVRGFALLGGQTITSTSNDFQGGSAVAFLGGCKVDLRGAAIKSDRVILELFAFWGGIEVLVPSTWSVQLEGFPILGGFDDKTHPHPQGELKRLVIRGTAIMGGIEVKN